MSNFAHLHAASDPALHWNARYTDLWFAIGSYDTLTYGLQFVFNFIHLQPLTLPHIGMHNTLTCGLQFITSAKNLHN